MYFLLISLAQASGSYPGVVASELSVDAPACALCHDGSPGVGTATTPIALSLIELGLVAQDDASLVSALADLESQGADSDGDGVGDVDELVDGTDPNGAGDALFPQYGCVGSTRPGHPLGFAALLGMLGVLVYRRRGSR